MNELEANLTALAERESVVRAWVHRHPDEELRQAARALPDGPLHGWTLGVKDVIDTFDLPTERGSPIYAGRQTVNDAACVALARRAGALVIGKTVTTEFALFTANVTTSPHDPTRSPGGSSSGSAAAVAAGMTRAAFGTQTVGSVIRPAAFCGVVGFKCTHQAVPMTGIATLAHSLDTLGWFTRSVDDAATLYRALSGAEAPSPDERRRRFGLYRAHQWPSAQPEQEQVLETAASALDAAGAQVIKIDPLPHLQDMFSASETIMAYESSRVFAWEREHHADLLDRRIHKLLTNGDRVTAAAYGDAKRAVAAAAETHDRWLIANEVDALVTPSAPGEAPLLATTGDSVFNRVWTLLGGPAAHLPTGRGPLGLPVGVQLTGRRWDDLDLLATAQFAETALADPERDRSTR
ncbi:MAG: amidase [Acidimicrobiaceae bacterium]|nr:amidase [Acidimicrobiaceae bacterium]